MCILLFFCPYIFLILCDLVVFLFYSLEKNFYFLIPLLKSVDVIGSLVVGEISIWNFHHLDLTAWDKLRANKKEDAIGSHVYRTIELHKFYKKRPEIVRWNLPVPLIGTGYGHFGYLEISWSKGDGGWTTGVFVEPPRWKNCFLCFLSRKTPIWKINKFAPFKEHTFHQCSICLSPWNNMYKKRKT